MRNTFSLATASLFLTCMACAANAEIGVPAGPGGLYFSLEGGYQQTYAPGVAAQGTSTTVNGPFSAFAWSASSSFPSASPPPQQVAASAGAASATASSDGGSFIHASQGGYSEVSLGYVLPAPLFGFVSRIEAYGSGSFADANHSAPGAFGFRSVDNTVAAAVAAVPFSYVAGDVTQSIDRWEIGFRIKADEHAGPLALAFSAEPFFMHYAQYTNSEFSAPKIPFSGSRSSQVSADLYGGQLATEGVLPLFGHVSLIGRASAGVYGLSADGNFDSLVNVSFADLTYYGHEHDGETRMGYRLGAQAGLRYAFSQYVWLSLIGSVDYFSRLPTAVLPRTRTDAPAHMAFSSQTDWRAGVRLTLANF